MQKSTIRWLVALVVSAVLVILWIVPSNGPDTRPDEVMSLSEVQKLFQAADGWIALPLADSKYDAGAIVRVDSSGIRRISHMSVCGYPTDVLRPDTGVLPQLTTDRQLQLGVELVGTIDGIRLGPESRRARAVGVRVDSITTENIDPIRIAIWEDEGQNYDSVSTVCRERFEEPDIYVVGEAARVNRGTYTFYDSAWSRIQASAGNLSQLIDASAGARAEATNEGSVVIVNPVTIAMRRAYWAGDGFRVLGPDDGTATPTADSLLAVLAELQATAADSARW